MTSRRLFTFLSLACLFGSPWVCAQQAPVEPPADVLAQLDFWLGHWEVSWTDAKGETQKGTNTITRILGEKVIREEFDASEAMNFRGQSYSVYDRASQKWKQTWVDDSGHYMDFVGRKSGDTFIFQRTWTRPDGWKRQNRMVFKNISEDALTWDWEGREFGAKDWKLLWRLEYKRID